MNRFKYSFLSLFSVVLLSSCMGQILNEEEVSCEVAEACGALSSSFVGLSSEVGSSAAEISQMVLSSSLEGLSSSAVLSSEKLSSSS
ncbi:hypothetical protein OAA91_00650 [Fibrobacterales bacterium]|nr:hypothetical protein [Fibrobacterales bacterium]